MILTQYSGRAVKDRVYNLLRSSEKGQALEELQGLPSRKVINSLFSFLYHGNPIVKWSAVRAMGVIVNHIAHEDMESARIIIRRLMWNLNDESGGIGWGSCEAMGEILALNQELAREYSMMLISYARKDGNFQEHELMQRGVLWGIGRLAMEKPYLVREVSDSMPLFFDSPDAAVRGHAAWAAGLIDDPGLIQRLEPLTGDHAEIEIYIGYELIARRISDLANEAIANLILSDRLELE